MTRAPRPQPATLLRRLAARRSAVIRILYPALTTAQAAGVVVPHETANGEAAGLARAASDGNGRRAPTRTNGQPANER